jgi:hypothetical protein
MDQVPNLRSTQRTVAKIMMRIQQLIPFTRGFTVATGDGHYFNHAQLS